MVNVGASRLMLHDRSKDDPAACQVLAGRRRTAGSPTRSHSCFLNRLQGSEAFFGFPSAVPQPIIRLVRQPYPGRALPLFSPFWGTTPPPPWHHEQVVRRRSCSVFRRTRTPSVPSCLEVQVGQDAFEEQFSPEARPAGAASTVLCLETDARLDAWSHRPHGPVPSAGCQWHAGPHTARDCLVTRMRASTLPGEARPGFDRGWNAGSADSPNNGSVRSHECRADASEGDRKRLAPSSTTAKDCELVSRASEESQPESCARHS